jgi:CheY-like chemotaxis protein
MSYAPTVEYEMSLARVLLVDDDPTARLTLKTVLEAGGYSVDAAASAAEAVMKMDEGEYQLVLSDLQMESPEAGLKVIAHAKNMDYKPATALIQSYRPDGPVKALSHMLIAPEDLPGLLDKVADLISLRATRRLYRELRVAGA